jgi:flagellar biogenesis protein FliO
MRAPRPSLRYKDIMPAAPSTTPGYLSGSLGTLEGGQAASFEAPSLIPTLLNVGLSLAFVVTLIYVVNWLLRRWRAGRGIREGNEAQGVVQVLEKTWIDNKRGLAVVEMGGEVYFLGLGDDVSLLSKVSDPAAVAKIRDAAPSPGGLLNFQEQLEKVGVHLRREQWKKNRQDLKSNAAELDKQIEKLKPTKRKEAE